EYEVALDALGAEDAAQRRAFADGDAARLVAVARLVLAAFAGVGLAADAVHRHRQRGVRLGRDRTQRHRAGGKALDDLRRRLDLVQRDRGSRIDAEFEQPAQGQLAARLVVDQTRVLRIGRRAVGAGGV